MTSDWSSFCHGLIRVAVQKQYLQFLFLRKCKCNNNRIHSNDSYIYFTILRIFFHSVPVIFNTLLPTLSKKLRTSFVKFPSSTSEHVTTRCHLQNGVHVVCPLQDQTGCSRKVPDMCCEQDGEEHFMLLLRLLYVCISWR
jgi:hypothetical protein